MFFVEPFKTFELRSIGAKHAGFSHGRKQPESLSLITTINQHYKAHDKVHALTVSYLVIVDRKYLKSVHERLLSQVPVLFLIEEGMIRKRTVKILHDVVKVLTIFTFGQ